MKRFRFRVYGKVVGKARPRVTRYGAYTPKRSRDYEKLIADSYVAAGGFKFEGEIEMEIQVFRALPKNTPKKVLWKPDTVRPDIDNIAKSVLDALNGVAYDDDLQVTKLTVTKHPRGHNEEFISVEIKTL